MSPPAANIDSVPTRSAPVATGHVQADEGVGFDFGGGDLAALATPPTFSNVEDERAYLKVRPHWFRTESLKEQNL